MTLIITGLDALIADLGAAPARLAANTRKAITVTARTIRDDARQRISGHPHLPAYPYSITYDVRATGTGVEAEIGPDKDRSQGPLGNIVEYGTSKNAPLPHLGPALDAAAPDAERGVSIAVQDALR
ncbi:HK97-gp10 family putative phage morphogenesis protein [Kitasatospora sp. NPDC001175]|uniref:HK97-gp10 family putative phage morphogenesis protein n=1 Tax=Kitasatospora sp. NPDC001175 TaxID=3157103 RepID=UPI003D023B37